MTNNKKNIQTLQQLLKNLYTLLESESEKNWVRAIKLMLNEIEKSLSGDSDEITVINYLSRTYRSINAGNGSFSDFCVWRDNVNARRKENEKLQGLKNDLWRLLK